MIAGMCSNPGCVRLASQFTMLALFTPSCSATWRCNRFSASRWRSQTGRRFLRGRHDGDAQRGHDEAIASMRALSYSCAHEPHPHPFPTSPLAARLGSRRLVADARLAATTLGANPVKQRKPRTPVAFFIFTDRCLPSLSRSAPCTSTNNRRNR